jgi:hypothetical protein
MCLHQECRPCSPMQDADDDDAPKNLPYSSIAASPSRPNVRLRLRRFDRTPPAGRRTPQHILTSPGRRRFSLLSAVEVIFHGAAYSAAIERRVLLQSYRRMLTFIVDARPLQACFTVINATHWVWLLYAMRKQRIGAFVALRRLEGAARKYIFQLGMSFSNDCMPR